MIIRREEQPLAKVYINGKEIEQVQEFKYLAAL